MATIVDYIRDICVHTAVYWGSPQNDGFGEMTYATPVEVSCFWIDEQETLKNDDGTEWVTKAKVFVLQDMDEQGVLYLGALSGLSVTEKSTPLANLQKAREIKRFLKTPSLYDESTYVMKVIL